MNITVVTPRQNPVVTPQQVQMHLRLASDEYAALAPLMDGYVEAATEYVEQATRRALGVQELRLSANGWRGLELYRPPFRRLLGVSYWNDTEAQVDLDVGDFYVTDDLVPSIHAYSRVVDTCWDATRVSVTYEAGYENVPAGLRNAVLLQVQMLADRFDVNEKADLERTRDALMSSFKVHNLHGRGR